MSAHYYAAPDDRGFSMRLNPEITGLLAKLDAAHPAVQLARNPLGSFPDRGICVNEWLRHKGYLTLRKEPTSRGTPISQCDVDWTRTLAWAEGGYYARVFLNVKGRDPEGIVGPAAYDRIRGELSHRLAQIPDDFGRPMRSLSHCMNQDSEVVRGPDLITLFGDMRWRAVGSVGWNALHVFEGGERLSEDLD